MRKNRKLVVFILCFAMLLCNLVFQTNAAEETETYDVTVGDYQCNYNEDGTLTIMNYTGREENLTIPATLADRKVTAIGGYAFSSFYLKSVTISSGITRIEKNAFRGAWYIEKLTIPESVTFIGESAFANMDALTSITLPSGITELSPYLFSGCDMLSSVQFQGNITSIGDGAFYQSGIQSISMPDSVTEIGISAFFDCENLKNITLSKNLIVISSYAFAGSGIESIGIPEGVKEIKSYAFRDCDALEQITLPVSLETIGSSTFRNTGLKRITLGENVSSIDWSNGDYTSSSITSFLESPDLDIQVSPENKNFSSKDGALYNKEQSVLLAWPSARGAVMIPDTVTSIGGYSFAYTNAESVCVPDSVSKIGSEAFHSSKLISVILGNGLEVINSGAFSYCENLTSITIPALVTYISNTAFSGSSQLSIAVAEENANFSDGDGVLYDKAKEMLLAAPGVSGEYIVKNGVTAIGSFAFAYNDNITEIYTGDTVTEVGNSAFFDCENLERLILGDSIRTLKNDMVYSCKKLQSIEGGRNATDIYRHVAEEGKLFTAFDIGSVSGKWKTAMIIGEANSGIVQFAIANNLPYMIAGKLGDVNCDGEIDAKDALSVLKYNVKIEQDLFWKKAADVNGDNEVDAKDALDILKHSVGILQIAEYI